MASWNLMQRLAQGIFSGNAGADVAWPPEALVRDGVEAVVDAVEPRLRLLPRYQTKLAEGVRTTLLHLRGLGREALQEPLELSPKAWNEQPSINALFAVPQDIVELVGSSEEPRAYFEAPEHAGTDTVWLLLAALLGERTVFAPVLNGDRVVHDVRQTQIGFSKHVLLAPAGSLQEARVQIGWRILARLAGLAAGRIAEMQARAGDLDEQRAMIHTKLRALRAQQTGFDRLAGDAVALAEKIRRFEQAAQETGRALQETRADLASLDTYVEQINQILRHPEEHLGLAERRLRIDTMGMVIDGDGGEGRSVRELRLLEIRIGPDLRAIVEIVTCRRELLPPRKDMLAEAARFL
jgi:hypothetical protein